MQLIENPDGDFVWEDSGKPLVFIAGGIGVTPFYSILKQRVHDGQPLNVTLIYASRTPEVPFKNEFDEWAAKDSAFTVKYAVGVPLKPENMLELAPALTTSLTYISGPEPMVEDLGDGLIAHGVPKEQLKQDFFPNYTESNF